MARKKVELTEENYFSKEMNKKYLSVSQIKSFIGCNAFAGCEAKALAELKGELVREKSKALLVGSYVDIKLTGTDAEFEKFASENAKELYAYGNPEKGLKAEFKQAENMIARVKKDKVFMKTLAGKHQNILTGKLWGVPVKIKVDSLGETYIDDLKTCESISKGYYDATNKKYISFIEHYNYILQGAIYQEIVKQNTGKLLPFFLSCVSKENEPDIEIIQIDNETLHDELWGNSETNMPSMEDTIKHIDALKKGKIKPIGCGKCDYCRSKKVLKSPIHFTEVMGKIGDE